jgi:CBASS immunity sensor of nucleotide second messenger signals
MRDAGWVVESPGPPVAEERMAVRPEDPGTGAAGGEALAWAGWVVTRMAGGSRGRIPERERLLVWVRAGGRCAICNRYLLESGIAYREVRLGELAHVVGQKPPPGSPRGQAALPPEERDLADNIVLLCADDHGEIDHPELVDLFTVERLRQIKQRHEDRIRHVTALGADNTTVVLRVIGTVRGAAVEVPRAAAAAAVVASAGRFPAFALSHDRQGLEVDLRGIPGEADADEAYYRAAARAIDTAIAQRLAPAVAERLVPHLSVFAFARLPLLVYLGSRLDDTIPTQLYQRHRHTEQWTWPQRSRRTSFIYRAPPPQGGAREAVLVVSASATIHPRELPAPLRRLPAFTVEPERAVPGPDVITNPRSLASFKTTMRRLFANLERDHKQIRRLHLIAAMPVSAAVTLGRCITWGIHPSLAIYERTDTTYHRTMEITHP